MTDDFEYFQNKRNDRVYLSRSLDATSRSLNEKGEVEEFVRPFRIVSKVIDTSETHQFFKDGKEISLRITEGNRQEIRAKYYEDTRGIITLQIQRYTVKTGVPHNTYFTFVGKEISILYNFIRNTAVLPLPSGSSRLSDSFTEELVLTRDQAFQLLGSQPDLLEELAKHQTTSEEVALLGQRKTSLAVFDKLLNDPSYFNESRDELGPNKKDEDVWQHFFEQNTWIFGYGLNFVFNSPLEGRKLEQVVGGYDFQRVGKRIDGLLKTTGLVSSLCFGEIKTHKTLLLSKSAYRSGSWSISDQVAGALAQVHRTVQISIQNLRTKTETPNKEGVLTGEQLFLYDPKAFLVVGSLTEFQDDNGINEMKFSSFEMFRRNTRNPEIITFDELYERAKFIAANNMEESGQVGP